MEIIMITGLMSNDEIRANIKKSIPLPQCRYLESDVGEGAVQIYSLNSSKEEYEEYCRSIEKEGYALYTANIMNKTLCATYCNGEVVINVVFGGDTDRSLRIVAEPLSRTRLQRLEKPADAEARITASSISMVDHWADRTGNRWGRDGNLCLVIRLSNGHFIVVDGNHNALADRNPSEMIFDHLLELAEGSKPIIDAWILTHYHQDHIGGFIDFCNNEDFLAKAKIGSVIYSFPNEKILYKTTENSVTDRKNIELFYSSLKERMTQNGTVFYQARTGQKYYFGNSEIEILWTFEDIAPHSEELEMRTNGTSIGFTVTIEGQKIMITGDSSTEEFKFAEIRYGSYLKSDFVQLSHHGYGDGSVEHEFYKYVNAPYVINSGLGVDYGYGKGERWAKENANVYILREACGTCVITLPYDGGEFKSTIPQNK